MYLRLEEREAGGEVGVGLTGLEIRGGPRGFRRILKGGLNLEGAASARGGGGRRGIRGF